MTQEAIFWTLLTTVLAGIHVSLGKVIAQKKINGSLNSIFTFLFSSIVFGVIFLLFKFPIPENYIFILFLALCGGFVYGISFITRIYSLHHIDSVLFFPINKIIGPIFAVSAGILIFKEQLTNTQMFGVLISIFVPILLINRLEKQRQTNLYLGLVLLVVSTFFGAIQNIFLKLALNLQVNIFFIVTFVQLFAFLASISIFLFENKKHKLKINISKDDFKYGITSSIIALCSFGTFMKALSLAPLSLLYTIHAHYILIPIIFSVIYYKEHIDTKKVLAVFLSMIAIAFLI